MRRAFILLLFFLGNTISFGQSFLALTDNEQLALVNLSNCTSTIVLTLNNPSLTLTDIAYTPDGTLYAINTLGSLYRVNTNTGGLTFIHEFPNGSEAFYTSLTADPNGILYTAGISGVVRTYNPATGQQGLIGLVDFGGAAGDLTFVEGQLVMASNTNQMVAVNLENPGQSESVLDFFISGLIFGIITIPEDCENPLTVATNDSNPGRIYRVNFDTDQLEFLCQVNHGIFGAASEQEFQAALSICITDIITTPSSCTAATGTIDIMATDASGMLTYSLDGVTFQDSPFFDELAAGTYTIYVMNDEGELQTAEAIIEDESALIEVLGVSVTQVFCDGDNGSLSVDATSANPPLRYSVDGTTFQESPLFEGLGPGFYTITLQDGEGCSTTTSASISDVSGPQINNIAVDQCNFPDNSLTIEASGNGPFLYRIDDEPFQVDASFNDLGVGTYTVTVIDVNDCEASTDITISEYAPIAIDSWVLSNCGVGASTLSVTASGGTGALSYQLDQNSFQAVGIFEQLSPASFRLTIADEGGCTWDSTFVIAPYQAPIIAAVEQTPAQCSNTNGSLSFSLAGDGEPFSVQLNNTPPSMATAFTDLTPGLYLVQVTDQRGCITTDSIVLTSTCPVYIPNVFSPNRDGFNDRFQVFSDQPLLIEVYQIFNRWGGLVFEQESFDYQELNRYWDGTQNGEDAQVGVYTYRIELRNAQGVIEKRSGDVTLVR
ncbi:MAG: gliding motility-associated C-terminal domain-containing protein [Bacteroidota bacterium]